MNEFINIINFSAPSTSNTFAKLIMWLVSITSSVALGVILFTLFLKLITLPFDFMSRFSMRKNSIKMEQMRPELEKLQQQYANNKTLYNQKMMALYKKNGYSMFGACLPVIITLVVFIIAINGFNAYSHYQNKQYFYDMSISYNNAIYAGLEIDGEYIYVNDEGAICVNDAKILEKIGDADEFSFKPDGKDYWIIIENNIIDGENNYFTVKTTNGYIKYKSNKSDGGAGKIKEFEILPDGLAAADAINKQYNNGLKNSAGKTYLQAKEANEAARAENPEIEELNAEKFLSSVGSYMAAETFRNNGSRFLWVKNIWITDSPTKNPVESSWKSFKSAYDYDGADIESDKGYTKLIAELEYEKSAPNGYFILVILTALSSLLTQFVIGRSQKAQMELQTVNGQGAHTQKVMMWIMPIMMAIFAFFYTAAFSLYIVLSSIIGLFTTLIINYIADKKFKPKETGEGEVIRGRVYVPPKKEEPTKADKAAKKKDKTLEDGFLSGLADKKKHQRGRLK